MTSPALVTFAIPVRRPISLEDRSNLDRTLGLTLRSIFAQTDRDFRVLAAMSHKPSLPDFVDDRFQLLDAGGWSPSDWHDANLEAGYRRRALAFRFAELGGGYLMYCDNDDFLSNRLVAHVRATMHPNGYAAEKGFIFDASANTISPYPGNYSQGRFHQFCGTSAIIRLTPSDILAASPEGKSFSETVDIARHDKIVDRLEDVGRPLCEIPFPAVAYMRNSGANLSDYADDFADPKKAEGLGWFNRAIIANKIENDGAIREEFSIPKTYPNASSVRYLHSHDSPELPSLSVLICTHNRPSGLQRLLESLVPQVVGCPAREIIVVNDGTHDAAYEAVLMPFEDTIRYHRLENNVGIAAARNISASLAQNDYLVFTDDDTVPPPHWLDWLSMRLIEHPELDVVAGTTKPLWPENPSFFARVRAEHDLIPTTEDTGGTIIFPTACVAIRRALFEEMGGFGFPNFSGAGEDTELATRLFRRGTVMRTDKSWATHHEITEGMWGLCRRYRRYGYANGRLAFLTTSPAEHDYMLDTGHASWRGIWDWEYAHLIKHAKSVHKSRLLATATATLACVVKMAYWQGIKDSLRTPPTG